MNPFKLMQMKTYWERFSRNHPKFTAFLAAMQQRGIREGTVIEIRITSPEGETITSNLRLTADDIALIQEIGKS